MAEEVAELLRQPVEAVAAALGASGVRGVLLAAVDLLRGEQARCSSLSSQAADAKAQLLNYGD